MLWLEYNLECIISASDNKSGILNYCKQKLDVSFGSVPSLIDRTFKSQSIANNLWRTISLGLTKFSSSWTSDWWHEKAAQHWEPQTWSRQLQNLPKCNSNFRPKECSAQAISISLFLKTFIQAQIMVKALHVGVLKYLSHVCLHCAGSPLYGEIELVWLIYCGMNCTPTWDDIRTFAMSSCCSRWDNICSDLEKVAIKCFTAWV